jgi:acetylglutamate kinase
MAEFGADVHEAIAEDWQVALVHGGGPHIDSLLQRLGVASTFVDGLRVTSNDVLEVVAMALGYVNQQIVAGLNAAGIAAVGISGVDGGLFCSQPLGDVWQRAGETPKVNTALIMSLWNDGYVPVISPVSLDDDGGLLNCNADSVAGALAGALEAQTLLLLSDVDQLRADANDPQTGIASIGQTELRELLVGDALRDGMRPKMRAALDALDAGAARVVLGNGASSHALGNILRGQQNVTEVLA